MTELELIERIRKRVPLRQGRVVLGIGDDCAVFRPQGSREDLLFTTDLMVEGVHFRSGEAAQFIGAKALARGLSDIAAMGGTPQFCLVSLALREANFAEGFYRGLLSVARRHKTVLAGGDLSRARRITVDIVVCGSVARGKALRRDGARPGDSIYVSGPLGRAASRTYHDLPEPRLAAGRKLLGQATACMDLSDGLSIDLHRLCLASNVAARLSDLPLYGGATLDQALHGGEDYELLFTGPEITLRGTYHIGEMIEGPPGTILLDGIPVNPSGHDHFAAPED